jgi:hypothetical protein
MVCDAHYHGSGNGPAGLSILDSSFTCHLVPVRMHPGRLTLCALLATVGSMTGRSMPPLVCLHRFEYATVKQAISGVKGPHPRPTMLHKDQ